MKKVFKKVAINNIQSTMIENVINQDFSGNAFKIGEIVAQKIKSNINKDFDINENAFFYIEIHKELRTTSNAKTKELYFRVDKMTLLDNNEINVESVKFINLNKNQINKFFR